MMEVHDKTRDERMTFDEHAETNSPRVLEPTMCVDDVSCATVTCAQHEGSVCCLHSVACTTLYAK